MLMHETKRVEAEPLLSSVLGFAVVEVTVAVFVMCGKSGLGTAVGGTCPTRVKTWPLVTARLGFVHVIVPPEPIAGVVQDQPPGDESETKVIELKVGLGDDEVVTRGSVSFNVTLEAAAGPLLSTVMV